MSETNDSSEEKLFQTIPFTEAINKTAEYDEKIKSLKSQGAVLNGTTTRDQEYTDVINKAAILGNQLSIDENYLILAFFQEKQKNPNLKPEDFEKEF